MKRRISIVLIIVLVITLVTVSFKYKTLLDEHNGQQSNVNGMFQSDLSIASNLFAGNFLTNENSKNYNYNHAISQIASAFQLFQFTTYRNNNNGLFEQLDNLYNLMERDEYKETILQKSNLIHEVLSQLTLNPEDKQATENLSNLIEEIRLKK